MKRFIIFEFCNHWGEGPCDCSAKKAFVASFETSDELSSYIRKNPPYGEGFYEILDTQTGTWS
jgi:hypothetical protein